MTELLEKVIAQASQLPDAQQDAVALSLLKTLEQFTLNADGTPRSQPLFGSASGLVWMSDDFDEPLADFKDYM